MLRFASKSVDRFECHDTCVSLLKFSNYFNLCCFRAMTLSLLHLVVKWQVLAIDIIVSLVHCVPYKEDTKVINNNLCQILIDFQDFSLIDH